MADRPAGLGVTRRRRSRARHAFAWVTTLAIAAVTALPWIRAMRGRAVTIVRSLMPWATIPAVPVVVLAARSGRRTAAVAAGAVAATGVAASVPLLVRRPQPRPAGPTRPLSILHANLLFDNIRMHDVALTLEQVDADVLTFSEYTPHHARLLRASSLVSRYPHRIEQAAALASGTALWSRYPVTADHPPATRHHTVVGDVAGPDGSLRVIVVHTQSPVIHHRQWSDDLAVLATVTPGRPAVMTGDFNAGWWHPEFRAVLANGWRDVHHVVGRGLSPSWPVVRAIVPPFIRLDHALVNGGVIVDRVRDVDIPGSDHRGLLVDVSVMPAG
jgi:endonuclease/exonuclease/phosphatase (EEP) superfamily protein YafD